MSRRLIGNGLVKVVNTGALAKASLRRAFVIIYRPEPGVISPHNNSSIFTAAFVGAKQAVAGGAPPARRALAHPCSPVADSVVAALGLHHVGLPLVDGHRANLGPHLASAPRAVGRDVPRLHGHPLEGRAEPVETLAPVHES